jgi:hypothetical protein
MQWLKSRRLHYLAGGTAILLLTLALLRLVFLFGFSDIDLRAADRIALLQTLGVGLRFDLRLALLITYTGGSRSQDKSNAWQPKQSTTGQRLPGRGASPVTG